MTSETRAAPIDVDPVLSDRFLLAIDNVPMGFFLEVTGLEVSVGVETYEEGGENGFVHKFPGRMTWPNLVFSRGITHDDALLEWLRETSGEGFAASGNALRRTTGAVSLVDHQGQTLRSWSLIAPFPVHWQGPELVAGSSHVLVERIEVAHHGFTTSGRRQW